MDRSLEQSFSGIFGYVSLVLALPVLVFSARDFILSAWQGVRTRTMNIDIPFGIGHAYAFFPVVMGSYYPHRRWVF